MWRIESQILGVAVQRTGYQQVITMLSKFNYWTKIILERYSEEQINYKMGPFKSGYLEVKLPVINTHIQTSVFVISRRNDFWYLSIPYNLSAGYDDNKIPWLWFNEYYGVTFSHSKIKTSTGAAFCGENLTDLPVATLGSVQEDQHWWNTVTHIMWSFISGCMCYFSNWRQIYMQRNSN